MILEADCASRGGAALHEALRALQASAKGLVKAKRDVVRVLLAPPGGECAVSYARSPP